MPPSTSYRQSEPPDSPVSPVNNDSDSDVDLDLTLEELDPAAASATLHTDSSRHRASSTSTSDYRAPRIALRNLRMGGLRRTGNRSSRGYGELGRDMEGDEDAMGLLDDDDHEHTQRYSDGSRHAGDDAPLLDERGTRRRSPARSFERDAKPSRFSFLRLPNFLSRRRAKRPPPDDDDTADKEEDDPSTSRLIAVGSSQSTRFPPNLISNAKYTAFTFLPITLYNEFSFFFNMYFLLVALSQALPALRIGYISTYIAPLAFVLMITMGKEAYDDIERRRRDNEANSEKYTVLQFSEPGQWNQSSRPSRKLTSNSSRKAQRKNITQRDRLSDIQEEEERAEGGGYAQQSSCVQEISKKSRDLKVGDVLKLGKGQRVPADVVILKCVTPESTQSHGQVPESTGSEALLVEASEEDTNKSATSSGKGKEAETGQADSDENPSGETFIRTDQLDGETDWKLRLASPLTQSLPIEEFVRLRVMGGKPDKKVNEFIGTVELMRTKQEALSTYVDEHDQGDRSSSAPLSIDNTAWANTVIASQATTMAVIAFAIKDRPSRI